MNNILFLLLNINISFAIAQDSLQIKVIDKYTNMPIPDVLVIPNIYDTVGLKTDSNGLATIPLYGIPSSNIQLVHIKYLYQFEHVDMNNTVVYLIQKRRATRKQRRSILQII